MKSNFLLIFFRVWNKIRLELEAANWRCLHNLLHKPSEEKETQFLAKWLVAANKKGILSLSRFAFEVKRFWRDENGIV